MLRRFFNAFLLGIGVHVLASIMTVLTIINVDATLFTFLTSITVGVTYFTFATIIAGDTNWRFSFGLVGLTLILGYMTWHAWLIAYPALSSF